MMLKLKQNQKKTFYICQKHKKNSIKTYYKIYFFKPFNS